jgi:hypothetical protein
MAPAPPPPARPPTSEKMLFAAMQRSGRNGMVRDRISLRRRLDELKNKRQRTEHPMKSTNLNSTEVGNARYGRDDNRCDHG